MKKQFLINAIIIEALCLGMITYAQDFTIGFVPDTQTMNVDGGSKNVNLPKIFNFFATRKDSLNLVFVATLGDMTETNSATEWARIKTNTNILDAAGIPWAPCQGNHDGYETSEGSGRMNSTYPVSMFSSRPYWGGSYQGKIENSYYLFEASGIQFVMVIMAYYDTYSGPAWPGANNVLLNAGNWARGVFNQYPTRKGILVSHTGTDIYERWLADNVAKLCPNVIIANQGHECRSEGTGYFTQMASNGTSKQHMFMSDYQCMTNTGGGAVARYYTFHLSAGNVDVRTYNTFNSSFWNGATTCSGSALLNCANFTFDMRLSPTVPVTYYQKPFTVSGREIKVSSQMTGKIVDLSNLSGRRLGSVRVGNGGVIDLKKASIPANGVVVVKPK